MASDLSSQLESQDVEVKYLNEQLELQKITVSVCYLNVCVHVNVHLIMCIIHGVMYHNYYNP